MKHKVGALLLALGMIGGVAAVAAPQAGAMICAEDCDGPSGFVTTMTAKADVYRSVGGELQDQSVPGDKTYQVGKGDEVTMLCWYVGPTTGKGKKAQNKWFAISAAKVFSNGKKNGVSNGLLVGFVPAPTVDDEGSSVPYCSTPDAYY